MDIIVIFVGVDLPLSAFLVGFLAVCSDDLGTTNLPPYYGNNGARNLLRLLCEMVKHTQSLQKGLA